MSMSTRPELDASTVLYLCQRGLSGDRGQRLDDTVVSSNNVKSYVHCPIFMAAIRFEEGEATKLLSGNIMRLQGFNTVNIAH